MTKGIFTYALLQYHHSQLLGEVLNIGLVAYFPDSSRLEFIFPEKLIRLRYAYPNIPEKTIKAYFRYFEQRVNELNEQPHIFHEQDLSDGLKSFLDTQFLPPDASALQFGNYRNSVLYTPNISQILDQLYNLYFSVFQIQDQYTRKIDESILLRDYKRFLGRRLHEEQVSPKQKDIYFDYSINPSTGSPVKFDVAWKAEQHIHLVKPVSFDLLRPESIQKKAWLSYGQFQDLEELAIQEDYFFDVILAKPKNDKKLFKAYDNAIRLLQKPNRVNLIAQDELEAYSSKTIDAVLNG